MLASAATHTMQLNFDHTNEPFSITVENKSSSRIEIGFRPGTNPWGLSMTPKQIIEFKFRSCGDEIKFGNYTIPYPLRIKTLYNRYTILGASLFRVYNQAEYHAASASWAAQDIVVTICDHNQATIQERTDPKSELTLQLP